MGRYNTLEKSTVKINTVVVTNLPLYQKRWYLGYSAWNDRDCVCWIVHTVVESG